MYPETYKYTNDHEWIEIATGRMGITDYAQKQLGDIVFLELPEVGRTVKKGEQIGSVESVKAVSEVFAPMSGTVTERQHRPHREAGSHQPRRARQLDGRHQAGGPGRGAAAARRRAVHRADQVTHRYIPNTDRGRAPDARGHRGPEHRRAVRAGSRGRSAPARARPAAGALRARPDGAPRRARGPERRRVDDRRRSSAPAPTATSRRASSTSSCCARSSTRPTRRISPRSRRARCRRSSSSRRWSPS